MAEVKDNGTSYEKGLVSKIKEIRDDAERLLERYEDIKTLPYSSQHKFLLDQIKAFIDSHSA